MEKNLKAILAGLSAEELSDLHRLSGEQLESQRRRASMDDIKPGMSKDQEREVLAEIQRVLGGRP
jgi:hypothetical protein